MSNQRIQLYYDKISAITKEAARRTLKDPSKKRWTTQKVIYDILDKWLKIYKKDDNDGS